MMEPDEVARWRVVDEGESADAASPGGDEQLVVALFDQSRGALLRYLSSLGISLQDGEEVLQETFLALFQHLRSGKSRRNLRGWIFRVAHNLALKRRLAARREISGMDVDAARAVHLDPAENPEEQLLSNQRQQRLRAILDALPERDRWCLALRAEGLGYREIAGIVDWSLGSVAASLARSLGRLNRAD